MAQLLFNLYYIGIAPACMVRVCARYPAALRDSLLWSVALPAPGCSSSSPGQGLVAAAAPEGLGLFLRTTRTCGATAWCDLFIKRLRVLGRSENNPRFKSTWILRWKNILTQHNKVTSCWCGSCTPAPFEREWGWVVHLYFRGNCVFCYRGSFHFICPLLIWIVCTK